MSRILARENLMKLVFEYGFNEDAESLEEEILLDDNLTDDDKDYIKNNLSQIKEKYKDILNIIEENLVNYKLQRICKTDLAILIISIFEIKYLNLPNKVVINEAVELAKKYSTDNSYKFVNGLLAKVVD